MYFRQILHTEKACASYLVGCPTLRVCAVIDPQGDPQVYASQVQQNGMTVESIIETHTHADHVSCARELATATNAPLYVGPRADVRFPHFPLADGQVLKVGNRRIRVLHTPGHTPEHICLLVDEWFLLTGDTLFVGDVGRVDLALDTPPPEEIRGRALQLHRSLQRLFAEYVGVGPKWVIRRYRIYDALERAATTASVDWVRLATDLGYSDQAHFSREFTSIVGTSPTRYAKNGLRPRPE